MIKRLTPADSPYTIDPKLLGPQLAQQPGATLYLSGGNGCNIVIVFPEIAKIPVQQGRVTIQFDDNDTGCEIQTSGTDIFTGLASGITSYTKNPPLTNQYIEAEFIADAGSATGVNRWIVARSF